MVMYRVPHVVINMVTQMVTKRFIIMVTLTGKHTVADLVINTVTIMHWAAFMHTYAHSHAPKLAQMITHTKGNRDMHMMHINIHIHMHTHMHMHIHTQISRHIHMHSHTSRRTPHK
jgi:predicted CDP-diglyceride synthetase/phosphatidate cytidylyltransferase